jgi:hypothetical protein
MIYLQSIHEIFKKHFKTSSLQLFIDYIHNFQFNCSYLLNRPTVTEHHIASRIANAMTNQEQNAIHDPLIRAHLKKKSK